MKKLLGILGAAGLVVSTSAVLVSCGGGNDTASIPWTDIEGNKNVLGQEITNLFTSHFDEMKLKSSKKSTVEGSNKFVTSAMIYTTVDETKEMVKANGDGNTTNKELSEFTEGKMTEFETIVRESFWALDGMTELYTNNQGRENGILSISMGAYKLDGAVSKATPADEINDFVIGFKVYMITDSIAKQEDILTVGGAKTYKENIVKAFNAAVSK